MLQVDKLHHVHDVCTHCLGSKGQAHGTWAQASKGVFNELSCHSAVGVEGAVTSVDRGEFNQLVHKHIALHRDAPLSQEDLDVACRHAALQ